MRGLWRFGFLFVTAVVSAGLCSPAAAQVVNLRTGLNYQAIRPALAAALDGDTLEIADGRYAGSYNRNLAFGGRSITLRSANGPAACTLDATHRDRLFVINAPGTSPVIEGLTLLNGEPENGAGGAAFIEGADPVFRNCRFVSSLADREDGGAVYIASGSPQFIDCVFQDNEASLSNGGAVYIASGLPQFTRCAFQGNATTGSRAGAVYAEVPATFIDCTFSSNRSSFGGAVYTPAPCQFINCVFTDNAASSDGGALHSSSTPLLTNCTFYENSTTTHFGTVIGGTGRPELANCILWSDVATTAQVSPFTVRINARFSLIKGWGYGVGNIDCDPLFVNAAARDLRLLPGSCAIDGGDAAAPGLTSVATDMDGAARIQSCTVDMGAFESAPAEQDLDLDGIPDCVEGLADPDLDQLPNRLDVDSDADGIDDAVEGTGDDDLDGVPNYLDLCAGDDLADADADGIGDSCDACPGTQPDVRVDLHGCAAITNATAGVAYNTIQAAIDAAADGDDIVLAPGLYRGGGNTELSIGPAAIHLRSATGRPECTIDCQGYTWALDMVPDSPDECVIQGIEFANARGLGVRAAGGDVRFQSCVFRAGDTGLYGGGLTLWTDARASLVNCQFVDNRSTNVSSGGSAIDARSASDVTVANCTFIGNSVSGTRTGTIAPGDNTRLSISNSIFWMNEGRAVSSNARAIEVRSSLVQGGFEGLGNIDADPLFIDLAARDLQLSAGSPAIDVGEVLVPGFAPIAPDAAGEPRVQSCLPDLGAFESSYASGIDSDGDGFSNCAEEATDADGDGAPGFLDIDSNGNGVTDDVEGSGDGDGDGVPDYQDLCPGANDASDDDADGTPDACDLCPQTLTGVVVDRQGCPKIVNASTGEAFATIQQAVDAALDGQEITLSDGFYRGRENAAVVFGGQSITIRSLGGAESCIIDGESTEGPWIIDAGAGPETVVEQITFQRLASSGGALRIDGADPTIRSCVFRNCDGLGWPGGGAISISGSPRIESCRFINNAVYAKSPRGGAMLILAGSPAITNCLFAGNQCYDGYGGAVHAAGSPTFTNCTFAHNLVFDWGSGSAAWISGQATFHNCVFWNPADAEEIYVYTTATPTITHSLVRGGFTGAGNIDADPLFRDPDGPDDNPATFDDNDYRLAAGSPAIDAGDNAAVTGAALTVDLDGAPRFADDPLAMDTGSGPAPIVDMGAFERQACICEMDAAGGVDVFDLLAYLDLWFASDAAADLDAQAGVSVFDLLVFLDCWFTASSQGC